MKQALVSLVGALAKVVALLAFEVGAVIATVIVLGALTHTLQLLFMLGYDLLG